MNATSLKSQFAKSRTVLEANALELSSGIRIQHMRRDFRCCILTLREDGAGVGHEAFACDRRLQKAAKTSG